MGAWDGSSQRVGHHQDGEAFAVRQDEVSGRPRDLPQERHPQEQLPQNVQQVCTGWWSPGEVVDSLERALPVPPRGQRKGLFQVIRGVALSRHDDRDLTTLCGDQGGDMGDYV